MSEFNEFLKYGKSLLALQKQYVILMDARKLGFLSSEVRIAQGKFFKEYKEQLAKYCLGSCVIVASQILKVMLKGMILVAPAPNATVIASNDEEAEMLVQKILLRKEKEIDERNLFR